MEKSDRIKLMFEEIQSSIDLPAAIINSLTTLMEYLEYDEFPRLANPMILLHNKFADIVQEYERKRSSLSELDQEIAEMLLSLSISKIYDRLHNQNIETGDALSNYLEKTKKFENNVFKGILDQILDTDVKYKYIDGKKLTDVIISSLTVAQKEIEDITLGQLITDGVSIILKDKEPEGQTDAIEGTYVPILYSLGCFVDIVSLRTRFCDLPSPVGEPITLNGKQIQETEKLVIQIPDSSIPLETYRDAAIKEMIKRGFCPASIVCKIKSEGPKNMNQK